MTGAALDLVVLTCRAHGLPLPEREATFIPGRQFRADYLWRARRVVLEIEGGITRGGKGGGTARGGHSTVEGILRDMEKSNLAQLNGFRYFRVTPRQVARGEIAAILIEALR